MNRWLNLRAYVLKADSSTCNGNTSGRTGNSLTPCGRPSLHVRRKGTILILTALMMVVMMGILALSIDVGYMYVARARLQNAADAASLACALDMHDAAYVAKSQAISIAQLNEPGHGDVLKTQDITFGIWDADNRTFTPKPAAQQSNAVQVHVRRSVSNNNPVRLFFAKALGFHDVDITATAIAYAPNPSGGARFLIDNEMFDTDIPAIEALAASLGKTSDDLLGDADGDWFIDMPPGVIELPTGQVGDVALWDSDHPAFPFDQPGKPTMEDFMNYNEAGGYRDNPDVKDLLDPLTGVSAADDPDVYASYVDPDFVHLSPVYESDVSALTPVYPQDIPTEHGVPAVNALGMRRGLVAFKIIGVGTDPDGPEGSLLPNLIIEILDPASVSLDNIQHYGGGRRGLVR